MKRALFVISALVLSFQLFSQTQTVVPFKVSSGTIKNTNWQKPGQIGRPIPKISSIALKYKFEPANDACKVTMSMQWYLGNSVLIGREEIKSPYISSAELSKYSIITIKVSADAYNGSVNIGKINFDLGKTPPSGGAWGADISEKRSWSSLFAGKSGEISKAALRKTVTLKNLRIIQIDFGGTEQFKQAAYSRMMTKGESLEGSGRFREALNYYSKANIVYPTRSEAKQKKESLAGRLRRYEDFVKKAESHFKKNEFYAALADYQAADKAIPNQKITGEKIGIIRRKIEQFKRIEGEASQILAGADTWRKLREAEVKFKQALAIMPVDQKSYITKRLDEVNYELGLEYNNFMQDGDKSLTAKSYEVAAKAFREATLIFPEKSEAKNKKAEVEKIVLRLIKKKYTKQISESIFKRNEAFDKAAASIDIQNERCFIDNANYFQCLTDHNTGLRNNAEQEMNYQLYESTYRIPAHNCPPSNCQPVTDAKQASANEYLAISKRKNQLFAEYHHVTFKNFRDEFLEKSIKLNPRNADAIVYKADLAETSMEKMALLNKALAINPSHEEALMKKENIKGNFYSEVYEKIAVSDVEYLEMTAKKGLLSGVVSDGQYTILEYAIHHDQQEALDFLLKNKYALSSSVTTNTNELLYFAVSEKVPTCTDYLLSKRNVNVNFQPEGKDPILVMAVKSNDFSNTKKLLDAGAMIGVRGLDGKTPLDISVEKDYPPLVELLLTKFNQSIPTSYIFTAIDNNSRAVLGMLLNAGADINVVDNERNTPLHKAVAQKKSGIAQLLVERRAQPDVKNAKGETPFLLACETAQGSIAEVLIQNGHNMELASQTGATPLYWTIQNNLDNVTAIMLQRGIDVVPTFEFAKRSAKKSFIQKASSNILRHAIDSENAHLAQTVIGYAPYAGFKESGGETSLLGYTIKKDNMDIFEILLKADPERTTQVRKFSAMHLAVEAKSMKYTSYLLDKLYNTTSVDKDGLNPLHLAAKVEFVEGLSRLAGRFKINAQDNSGMTPLHYAAKTNNTTSVSILLQNGANKKIKDNRRWTPKKLAKKYKKKAAKKLL